MGGTIFLAHDLRPASVALLFDELPLISNACYCRDIQLFSLAGQARMASKRARDRVLATSLEGLRDAATLHLLLLCLNNYFGNDVCSLGKNNPRY